MAAAHGLTVEEVPPTNAAETRPGPIGRVLAKARADWIEGDVSKRVFELIIRLDHGRAKSPFEEMTIKGVPVVEFSRVSAVELMHSGGKGLILRLDHQVKVIRHEAVRDVAPSSEANDAVEQAEEQLPVEIVPVYGLATIPARGDVEQASRWLKSRWSRHDSRLRSPLTH
jgi:hypothetical protein